MTVTDMIKFTEAKTVKVLIKLVEAFNLVFACQSYSSWTFNTEVTAWVG